MRVLTWNLFHGRAVPPAGRDLQPDFTALLASWEWDVALLQEVPPWWPPTLARACRAEHDTALTSRNAGLCLRRAIAVRAPDLIKANGGGANAILVRATAGPIAAREHVQLRRWPERRIAHGVGIERAGEWTWIVNLHAQVHSETRAQADIARAAACALAWADTGPLILGGDLNVRVPIAPELKRLGGHGVDHLLGRGLRRTGDVDVLPRGGLSDHAPVVVTMKP